MVIQLPFDVINSFQKTQESIEIIISAMNNLGTENFADGIKWDDIKKPDRLNMFLDSYTILGALHVTSNQSTGSVNPTETPAISWDAPNNRFNFNKSANFDGAITTLNGLQISNGSFFVDIKIDGISFSSTGVDADIEIVTLYVTGTPKIIWDESEDKFAFNKGLLVNDSGGDNDTRVGGDTDANLLFVDASTDRIGIGTSSPGAKLEIVGQTYINRAESDTLGDGFIKDQNGWWAFRESSNHDIAIDVQNTVGNAFVNGITIYKNGNISSPNYTKLGGSEYLKLHTQSLAVTQAHIDAERVMTIAVAVTVSKVRSITCGGVNGTYFSATPDVSIYSVWGETTSTTLTLRFGSGYSVGDLISAVITEAA
jgi:hypothetical protein